MTPPFLRTTETPARRPAVRPALGRAASAALRTSPPASRPSRTRSRRRRGPDTHSGADGLAQGRIAGVRRVLNAVLGDVLHGIIEVRAGWEQRRFAQAEIDRGRPLARGNLPIQIGFVVAPLGWITYCSGRRSATGLPVTGWVAFLSNIFDRLKELRLRLRRSELPGNANFPLIKRWKSLASAGLPILILKVPAAKAVGAKREAGASSTTWRMSRGWAGAVVVST